MNNHAYLYETESCGRGMAHSGFMRDLLNGLEHTYRHISPKYFYDANGSTLFDSICELPEYYPTRTELDILSRYAPEMVELMGPRADIVEFGAGSLTKIRLLFNAFSRETAPGVFIPVDISGSHLELAAQRLRGAFPSLAVQPLVADYTQPLIWPATGSTSGKRVGFFPGSSIGNFDVEEALIFLQRVAPFLRGGGLLIGVDMVKDPSVLHAAYNDSRGITARFNLNVLQRANSELEANFDLDAFYHHASYNPLHRRIEMHLVSCRRQTVHVGGQHFLFEEGDSLRTEYSYKYTINGFRTLAARAGFTPGPVWTDDNQLFSIHWLQAPTV